MQRSRRIACRHTCRRDCAIVWARRASAGLALFLFGVSAAAQTAPQSSARQSAAATRALMQPMADALGVKCAYCHVEAPGTPSGLDYRSEANPKKRIARLMMAMTDDINAAVPLAMLKREGDATRVHCATCHRGVVDPRPLTDILTQTIQQQNVAAAIARYRELRQRYFGRDAYDFSEGTLLQVAQKLAEQSPNDAIALLDLNLEFYPRSVDSYVLMGIAHTRRLDDEAALAAFAKALDINPSHGIAQGYVFQLQQYRRKKP